MEPIIFRWLRIIAACLVLMPLGSSRPLASTSSDVETRRAIVLPDGTLISVSDGDLFRQNEEGERLEQLTFTLGRLQSAALLPDGRILFLYRDAGVGRLFTMLPDGTWSTLWPGLEDLSVKEFTIASRERLLVHDASGDGWAVSIADPYSPRERISVDHVASVSRSQHTVDPLPSIVKPEMNTGFLFVIDVARTDDPELVGLNRDEIAELRVLRLESSGAATELAAVAPAGDGSVYIEAPADTPLAFEMVDRQGAVLARTQTPIWIRPNERRGCIGCHVSPAYAPPNVRPQALVQEPHRIASEGGVSR